MAGPKKYDYHVGRILLCVAVMCMGIQVVMSGNEFYGPYFHALRKAILTDSKNTIDGVDFTFEDVNKYLDVLMGVLFMVGGFLTVMDKRQQGPALIIAALLLIFLSHLNPWVLQHRKP